jgi:haloalkane dehalogenase
MTPPAWLDRAAYPFELHRFETADGALAYVDEGQGPPVLLVHGTPSWSFEFREVIRELSKSHHCIAVDHLGFGLSDHPADGALTPADHARRLRALVEALDLRALTLVVHDFGGLIGLPLVVDQPERVAGVVVLNSWAWPNAGDRAVERIDRVVRSPLGRFLYLRLGFSARVLLPSAFGDRRKLSRPVHRHYLAPLSTQRARAGTYAFALALRGSDAHAAELWAARGALSARPLTQVWGLSDPLLTQAHLARWVEAFPGARQVRLEGCGHFVAEERPEAVVAAVRDLSVRASGVEA